jgi:hypothetical protein
MGGVTLETHMLRLRISGVVLCALSVALASCSQGSDEQRVLSAADLYAGLEASRVLFQGDALVLDTRHWTEQSRGRIVTGVIDLGDGQAVDEEATASGLQVEVDADPGVAAQIRTGETYFQAPGTWTDWGRASGVLQPRGRYAQVSLEVTRSDGNSAPAVRGVTLSYRLRRSPKQGTVALVSDQVQRIVRSPIEFGYERPDQPDVAWLRKTFRLDDVIVGKKTEFEQLRALMHWTATRPNKRPGPWDRKKEPYPWSVRRVMTDENSGTIYGHCMSYCEVMITAAAAFGWQGRHWAIHGIRDTSHEVPEIWVNDLGKWVFFDPSLDTYYADQKTGEPLDLLEMHDLYLKTVLKPGEVQKEGRTVNEDRLRKLRGKHPIRCVTGDYAYGKPAKWDWQWDHGYMTAGWMQLTPRNDWHSRPEPAFRYFGWGPEGYDGFPLYIDAQTPLPAERDSTWYTRKRDFWWTVNQASFRLVRTGAGTLGVECGNSQPFFRAYLARFGDGDWKTVEERFTWTLQPGENRLEVVPEDEFGKRGMGSVVVVRYEP